MHNISFHQRYNYPHGAPGITIPIELAYGDNRIALETKLDTGAQFCLFDRGLGESVGIEIESGEKLVFKTVNGHFTAYGHGVSIRVLNCDFELVAYFYESSAIHRSVLGRTGWLPQTRLGLIDYDRQLYLSRYDD
jgi:hypothetical protein